MTGPIVRVLAFMFRPVADELRRQHEEEVDRRAIENANRMLTEAEVIERKDEFVRAMGPVFGALE